MSDSNNSNPLKYTGILFFMFLVLTFLGGYTFYKYYFTSVMMQGYSYLSDDLKNVEYLFENNGSSKENCLNDCKKDFLCQGITYDASSNICYGLTQGKLRSDDSHIYAWIKKPSDLENNENDNMLISWTNQPKTIIYRQMPKPPFPNKFAITFWVLIDNWYINYALWRNIIYQGTKSEQELTLTSWGDVITKIPKQRFGVWLAPYTNNIRVVIGTNIPYNTGNPTEHPVNQVCKGKNCYIKNYQYSDRKFYDLEFMDIKNVDVGVPFMICVSLEDRSLNIYHNGKLRHNVNLEGEPIPLNADCFIKQNKSYEGHFLQFRFWETGISSAKIRELYDEEIKNITELIKR